MKHESTVVVVYIEHGPVRICVKKVKLDIVNTCQRIDIDDDFLRFFIVPARVTVPVQSISFSRILI